MLEHVAPNQTRFVAPGLAPDSRGVALGRYLAVLLPSIDRVVSLFRGLSEAVSLDEVLPALKILQVKTPLASREFIVLYPVNNSYAADQVAAVAALAAGLSFTGSSKHFIKYRDSRSPLGHDVDSLHAGQGDFILYGADFVQAYGRDRELSFAQLAMTLSLQRARADTLRAGDEALLRVVPGLWRSTLGYLHRCDVPCAAAAVELASQALGAGPRFERLYLIRCQAGLPPRMVALFGSTPGVELMRLKLDRVAVQVGYRHPFELTSCATVFAEDRFFLLSGERDRAEVIAGLPIFVDASSLVSLGEPERPLPAAQASLAETGQVSVPLKLVPVAGATPRLVASRIPIEQGRWLKKLVYLLPPAVLGAYSVCVTGRWIYLLNEAGIDFVPLGEMFYSVAPGVMVPAGYQLIPRVNPEVLLQHLGSSGDQLFFFCRQSPAPTGLARGDFTQLGRMALAEVVVERPAPTLRPPQGRGDPEIVNQRVGVFPLWGFAAATRGRDPGSSDGE